MGLRVLFSYLMESLWAPGNVAVFFFLVTFLQTEWIIHVEKWSKCADILHFLYIHYTWKHQVQLGMCCVQLIISSQHCAICAKPFKISFLKCIKQKLPPEWDTFQLISRTIGLAKTWKHSVTQTFFAVYV